MLVILFIFIILNILPIILYISIIFSTRFSFPIYNSQHFTNFSLHIFTSQHFASFSFHIYNFQHFAPFCIYSFWFSFCLALHCTIVLSLFYSPFRFQLFTYSCSRNVLDLSFALILLKSFQKIYYTESCSRSITIEYRHINKNYWVHKGRPGGGDFCHPFLKSQSFTLKWHCKVYDLWIWTNFAWKNYFCKSTNLNRKIHEKLKYDDLKSNRKRLNWKRGAKSC